MSDGLLVTSSFLPGRGGIESHLAELCAALAPRLAVFAPGARGGERIPPDLGYEVVAFDGSLLAPLPRVLTAIERAATDHGTRRIVFGTPWPLALLGPALAARGYRYVVVVHGAEAIVPGRISLLSSRLAEALARADLLLPVSAFTRAKLEDLLTAAKKRVPPMHLLRARVDLDRFTPRARSESTRRRVGVEDDAAMVLSFGRLVPRKGLHRLLQAYPALVQRVPNVVLVIAGTGPEERRLRRLASRTEARAVFLGRVRDEDAPAVYAAADVFALPVADRWAGLDTEGLGVVLLEASASGVPCVTGRSGGTPEAVVDGTTGFVVDARRRADLVHAIASLVLDPELARRMGAAGRRHVEQNFAGEPPAALVDWLRS